MILSILIAGEWVRDWRSRTVAPGAAYQQDAAEGADFCRVQGLARLGADLRIA